MVADAGNSADWTQIPAGEFLAFRPPQNKEATGPHPAAISLLHRVPAEAYEALSRRPSAIHSKSQIFEQSLPYPFVMEYCLRIPGKGRHRVMKNCRPKTCRWPIVPYLVISLQYCDPLQPTSWKNAPKLVTDSQVPNSAQATTLVSPSRGKESALKTNLITPSPAPPRDQKNPQIAPKPHQIRDILTPNTTPTHHRTAQQRRNKPMPIHPQTQPHKRQKKVNHTTWIDLDRLGST